VTIREALRSAAGRLASVSDTARLDAEVLMAHALETTREAMLLAGLDGEAPESFEALVERRLGHEPVAYIVGNQEFWSLDFRIGPGVLVPRPESETLIEAAQKWFAGRAPKRILDLGTGPGPLLLSALTEWPEATGIGVDASEDALSYARGNAERLGLAGRAEFRVGDWAKGIEGPFDLILCNPPYLDAEDEIMPDVRDFEPHIALFGEEHGLAPYREVAPQIAPLLAPGGAAAIEMGAGMADRIDPIFRAEGFETQRWRDLYGHERCLFIHNGTAS
jgi:release factor glutamine methyltransferase